MSDKNKVSGLPDGVLNDALKIAQSCYSMGGLQTVVEAFLFGSEKNANGTYKNPFSEPGRAAIREACFDEVVAPKILNAKGTLDDVNTIRSMAKGEIREAKNSR